MVQLNKLTPIYYDDSLNAIEFPNFREITWNDQDLIKEAIRNIKIPSSTFQFSCLLLYNDPICEICFLNGNLILRITNLSLDEYYYVFCGFNNVIESISQIFNYQKNKGLSQALHFIPEEIIQYDSKIQEKYTILEDRDYFDYVYLLENLKDYASSDQHHHVQRNYRHFEEHFPNIKIEVLDVSNKETQIELIDEFKKWKEQKHKDDPRIEHEFKALINLFGIANKIRFSLIALKDNESLIGFEIHELIEQGFILGHFCKILPGYTGAEEVILHKIAEEYIPQGYKYLNVQEDLGVEGLRNHKLNLHPAFFIKSYAIYPKTY